MSSERSLNVYRTAVGAIIDLAKHNHHFYQVIFQSYPGKAKPKHAELAQLFFSTALTAGRVYTFRNTQTDEWEVIPPDSINYSSGKAEVCAWEKRRAENEL